MLDIDHAATVCECLLRHRDQGQDSKGTRRLRSGIHRAHLSGIFGAVTQGLRDHLQSRTQGKLFHCVVLAMRLEKPTLLLTLASKKAKILTHVRCHMDDARIAVETGGLEELHDL